jgi:SAM-dependent methyltransferase
MDFKSDNMPYSHPFHKDFVGNHIRSILTESDRVLDIGCGCGTYALLLPEIKMDGIEIYEPYVSRFGLQDLYQTLHIGDIREFDFSAYTYLIMGDVFEHLTFNEARDLLTRMNGKRVMIAVPYMYRQGEWEGNVYETHWQPDLTPEVMALRYPELKLLVGDAVYGYYINY